MDIDWPNCSGSQEMFLAFRELNVWMGKKNNEWIPEPSDEVEGAMMSSDQLGVYLRWESKVFL